jgi:hypothetical protein
MRIRIVVLQLPDLTVFRDFEIESTNPYHRALLTEQASNAWAGNQIVITQPLQESKP